MEKSKINKLFNKLKTDGEDIYQLSSILKNYYEAEEDVDDILNDIIEVKDDIIAVVAKLKKELK